MSNCRTNMRDGKTEPKRSSRYPRKTDRIDLMPSSGRRLRLIADEMILWILNRFSIFTHRAAEQYRSEHGCARFLFKLVRKSCLTLPRKPPQRRLKEIATAVEFAEGGTWEPLEEWKVTDF